MEHRAMRTQKYQYIQLNKQQQNLYLMDEHPKEECMGGFEEFTEEYLTYSRVNVGSPDSKQQRSSSPYKRKPEKQPKMKMMESQSNTDDIMGLLANGRASKTMGDGSKIIAIGTAIFRSNFESGNLSSVCKLNANTYEINLAKETNSVRISAWFYFACEGLKGDINFVVKGFTKTSSLYNSGMRVCYRETTGDAKWRRGGAKICYTESQIQQQDDTHRTTYQLRFSYFFKAAPNSVQFAFCFPYTYTTLLKFIKTQHFKYQILGKTYQGRDIPLLTVGNPNSKYAIFISARAHPGETVGSFMMQGFLKELNSSNSKYANYLRTAFLFLIVPMINVDGVVNGNYRFSGAGFDLNRKWKNCSEKMHPEVFLMKELIKKTHQQKQVLMYIDLHGHSRQKNVFFYGCCPKGTVDKDGKINTKPKQFPFLMSKLHHAFRYDYCSYAVQKQKEGTGRISTWNQLKIDYVYTLQASFCGSQGGANYLIQDYLKIGAKLCQGICLHFWMLIKELIPDLTASSISESSVSMGKEEQKLQEELNKNMNEFFQNPSLAQIDYAENSSDSEPEAGEIPIENRKKPHKSLQPFSRDTKRPIDQNNPSQNKITTRKVSFTLRNKSGQGKTKTDQSIKFKMDNLERFKQEQVELQVQKKTLPNKFNIPNKVSRSYYIRTDILNKNINEKLNLIDNSQRFFSSDMQTQNAQEMLEESDEKYINNKKKALSYQGAQYRRVRKLAQQYNQRNHSVNKVSFVGDSDNLIKGLVGMNNLVQIQRLHPRTKTPNVFPLTSTNYRNRKLSTELSFRRHHRQQKNLLPSNFGAGLDLQVKCLGKQII